LAVKKRPDRGMLISLYEQNKQILQVTVWSFETKEFQTEHKKKKPEHRPYTEEAAEAGAEVVVNIAKDYAADKLQRADLYGKRKEMMEKQTTKNETKTKKPAAAVYKEKAKPEQKKKTEGASSSPTLKRPAEAEQTKKDNKSKKTKKAKVEDESEVEPDSSSENDLVREHGLKDDIQIIDPHFDM
jgi:hypothetical protein